MNKYDWIGVDDRLPENDDRYLIRYIYKVGSKHARTFIGDYLVVENKWSSAHDIIVTHWMPLPDPPKEAEDEI